jgi:hypothetical protein
MNEEIYYVKIHPTARNILPKILFPILFIIFILLINLDQNKVIGTGSIIMINLCLGFLTFLVILGIYFYYISVYLLITTKGIEYHGLFYQIIGIWENIIDINRRVRHQIGRKNRIWFSYNLEEDLIVNNPEINAHSLIRSIIYNLGKDHNIPIRSIDNNWRNTEYGKYILMKISENDLRNAYYIN